MDPHERRKAVHDLDVTVWVGKAGIDSVVDELTTQLAERSLVKVKFLEAARGTRSPEELAAALSDRVDAEVVDVRGHTAVLSR